MKILHCHSTFSLGGKEARAVRLMNLFGDAASHTILSAVPDALGARDAIDPGIQVSFPGEAAPALHGKPGPVRYRKLAAYMQNFDLVLTYNWGAMDAVAAHRTSLRRLPRLIHHEDGFNADEAVAFSWKRTAFRRAFLSAAEAIVVPSRTLETVALELWDQPASRIRRIPNGIHVADYALPPAPDAIPGFTRRPGDFVVGTLAGLRAVKNLPRLVRAFAALPEEARLVIVGEGPERAAIMDEVARRGVSDRVHLPGFLAAPHRYMGLFDVFALSSDSEQFPISLLEAMAAGLPVVSTNVGDVANMVPDECRHMIVDAGDEAGFAARLRAMMDDPAARASAGAANQRMAIRDYDEAAMVSAYARLYRIGIERHDN